MKRVYVKKGANNEIKVESLLIKPGLNYINFSAPPSQDKSITALSSDIDFYSHEFSVAVDFAKSGSYYVELYAFPFNQVDYLMQDKVVDINKTKYSLNYKETDTSYVSGNKVKFLKGENVISFLRQKQENYYLFIKPKTSAQDTGQIEIKSEFINPVKYKVELKVPDDRYTFLFFNEAYDENWKAISKQTKSVIGNHFIANGYANAWVLNGLQNDGQTKCLMLKYNVQDQFYVGLIISFSVMICCFTGLFIILFRGLKNKRI